MARTNNNKYNYSHILQRDPSSSPASYSSVARSNGRMLVLTKPSPKPLKPSVATTLPPPPQLSPTPKTPDQPIPDPDPNQISLRPLGHTGPAPSLSFPARRHSESVAAPPVSVFQKPDKFVPPHLRPGFVRKQENPPGLDDPSQRLPHQEHHHHHQNQLGRPRSGGYERVRSDPDYLSRPRSSGKRPGTSG